MMAPWCRNKNVDSIHLKFRRISLFTRTNKTAPKNFYRSLILLPAPKNLTAPAPALAKSHLKIFTRTNTAPAPANRTRTKTAPAPRRLFHSRCRDWFQIPVTNFSQPYRMLLLYKNSTKIAFNILRKDTKRIHDRPMLLCHIRKKHSQVGQFAFRYGAGLSLPHFRL